MWLAFLNVPNDGHVHIHRCHCIVFTFSIIHLLAFFCKTGQFVALMPKCLLAFQISGGHLEGGGGEGRRFPTSSYQNNRLAPQYLTKCPTLIKIHLTSVTFCFFIFLRYISFINKIISTRLYPNLLSVLLQNRLQKQSNFCQT